MDNFNTNFPNGLQMPASYTKSFGRFTLDAEEVLKVLGYVQILDGFKDIPTEKVKQLATDPFNIELRLGSWHTKKNLDHREMLIKFTYSEISNINLHLLDS